MWRESLLLAGVLAVVAATTIPQLKDIKRAESNIINSGASTHDQLVELQNLVNLAEDEQALLKAQSKSRKAKLAQAIRLREAEMDVFSGMRYDLDSVASETLHDHNTPTQKNKALEILEDVSADLQEKQPASSAKHSHKDASIDAQQLFHAGSTVESLRQKLEESPLSQHEKDKYSHTLLDAERILSKLVVPQPKHSQKVLVTKLRKDMDFVHKLATQLEKDHTDDQNLNHFSMDLELLNSSDDTQENADLIEAIKLRLPAIQALAHQLKEKETQLEHRHHLVDLEREPEHNKAVDVLKEAKRLMDSSDLTTSKKETVDAAFQSVLDDLNENSATTSTQQNQDASTEDATLPTSETPESEPTTAVADSSDSVAETKIQTDLDKLGELEETVKSMASLSDEQRARYLSNLQALRKDMGELTQPSLTESQRNDLESALKLRVSMMQDMDKWLTANGSAQDMEEEGDDAE